MVMSLIYIYNEIDYEKDHFKHSISSLINKQLKQLYGI